MELKKYQAFSTKYQDKKQGGTKYLPFILGTLYLLLGTATFAQQKDSIALRYSNGITKEDLKKHLSILASDAYEGRETGMEGQKKAADYIANQYKSYGIPPLKDGSFFQKFDLYPASSSKTVITIKGKEYQLQKDFYSFRGISDVLTENERITFRGYGIEDKNYSDFKGEDKKGKNEVMMILEGEPFRDSISLISKKKKGSEWSEDHRKKVKLAKEKGAKALLIVLDSFEADKKKFDHFTKHPPLSLEKPENITLPVFYISQKMAESILNAGKSKFNIKEIKQQTSKSGEPIAFDLNIPIKIDYGFAENALHTENVLGYVEGSDLKDQLIVISAHYDHLGVTDEKVYNGADDDGSGTVSVIELAQAFAKAKKEGHGPRRSLLFLAVSAEEKGLLGSAYYVSNPVFPLANTVCDLNIDMIGRVDSKHLDSINYVYLIGSSMLSTKLHSVSQQCGKQYSDLKLDYTYDDPEDKNRFYYRSDHYNFAKKNIPVIFYFNGTHADYHKETDEVDKINFALMEKRAKLVFFTAWTLANMTERLVVDVPQKK